MNTPRFPCRKIRTREVVRDYPNFRDSGDTCQGELLALLCRVFRRGGETWASEAGWRKMLREDCGKMAGLDTVRRALGRFHQAGLIDQFPLKKGGVLPNGETAKHGTRIIVVPQCRRHRRAVKARAERHGEPRDNRIHRRLSASFADVQKQVAKDLAPPADAHELEGRRTREAQLAAIEQWYRDNPTLDDRKKPPD